MLQSEGKAVKSEPEKGGGGMFDLTSEEHIKRYSRHILLPEVGGVGQAKISAGKVLVVGTGGLGSPVGLYLTAAGVGTLALVDDDVVEMSNLQRQVVHATPDIGRPKVESAREKLAALNPNVELVTYGFRVTSANIMEIIKDFDIVVDGTDNFATRFLINDACVMVHKPFVHGSILRFFGQLFTYVPGAGPCYRCIIAAPPPAGAAPTCAEAGVLGVIAGTIGVLQATEVLKFLLGKGDLLVGRLLTYEALDARFREVPVLRNPACPVCGDNPTVKELIDYDLPDCRVNF